MIKQLITLILFQTIFIASCFAAKGAVVSVIFSSDLAPYQQSWKGFKEIFEQEGIPFSFSEYSLKRSKPGSIIPQIIKENPNIVYTIGANASRLAITNQLKPVVFSLVLNPDVFRNAHATGASLNIPFSKKLNNIKKVFPDMKRVGVIYSHGSTHIYNEISNACDEIGFQLVGKKIDSKKEFPRALKEISKRIDILVMIPDQAIYFPQSIKHLLIESVKKKFPVAGLSSFHTKAGAIISFESDYRDMGRQAGEIAFRILKGGNPGDIPASRPRKVKYSLNLLVAERFGIEIRPEIIKEASEVFEK
ncbi:MAG: ABC transporter substrate-binding protein [Candidatus Anammoxibacter sp.]